MKGRRIVPIVWRSALATCPGRRPDTFAAGAPTPPRSLSINHPTKELLPMFENADLIRRYSRAHALRNGVLIDVSAAAKEAGFKYPVALTVAV